MAKRRKVGFAAWAVLAAVCVAAWSVPAGAGYRLCALRDGPHGPCTCKADGDGAGHFTVVPKSRCRQPEAAAAKPETTRTAGAPAPSDSPAVPEAQTEGAAATQPAASPAAASPVETAALPASTEAEPRLDQVRKRGKLLCGVNTGLLGFSAQTSSGTWAGLDVEFCHALAAAVFGDAAKVEFVPLETNERFDALTAGKIDILSRNTTWTMSREVELGLRFAGILYFDGQGFMTGSERGLVSAHQLSGLKVCVEAGTTTETNMTYYFKTQQVDADVVSFPTREALLKAYREGACDAYSGDRSALYSERASLPEPEQHTILPEVISKEPLGPVVLKGDEEWAEIVRWTLAGLVNAEEVGLGKEAADASAALSGDALRLVDGAGASGERLRLEKTWLRDVVAAVGNYGEMFEANVGKKSALGMERGLNALWKRGGILSAPPMW